jgi:hypothetical protein
MKRSTANVLSAASVLLLIAIASCWIRSERVIDEFSWASSRGDIGLVTGGAGIVVRSMRFAGDSDDRNAGVFQHITAIPDDSPSSWKPRYTRTERSSSLFVPFWIPLTMLTAMIAFAHFGTPTVHPGNPPASR